MQKRYSLILTSEVYRYPKDMLHLEQVKESKLDTFHFCKEFDVNAGKASTKQVRQKLTVALENCSYPAPINSSHLHKLFT